MKLSPVEIRKLLLTWRKDMGVAHPSTYPYATLDQAVEEFPAAKDFVFGGNVQRNDGIKALHTQLSFVLGMAFPHSHSAVEVPPSFANDLVGLANAAAPAGFAFSATVEGVNWLSIVLMILELIKKFTT